MKKNNLIVLLFIALGLLMRLIPQFQHSAIGTMFSPVAAIALFSGFYLSKRWALIVPMAIMLISDYFIGYYNVWLMASVYGSFLITILLGMILKKYRYVIPASLLSSLLFFLITNFAVWYFMGWYPKTIEGLWLCFAMALPFFKSSIIGNLMYTGLFFGIYELSKQTIWITKRFYLSIQHQ
jgi:hypothetical protein